MQNTINERVKILIDSLSGGVPARFAKSLGVAASVIGNYLPGSSREGEPSFSVLQKISTVYPQINIEWLVTGEGEPFKSEGTIPPNNIADSRTLNKNTASGNTVSYGSVPTPQDPTELEYLRARVRELEQKNNDLLDRLLQVLNK